MSPVKNGVLALKTRLGAENIRKASEKEKHRKEEAPKAVMDMVFEYKNSKGKTYFLHQKGKLYYFSAEKKENAIDLPSGFKIVENNKTGLPMLKKK